MPHRVLSLVLALLLTAPAGAGEFSYKSGPKEMRVDVTTRDGTPPKALVLVLHTSGGYQQADSDYAKKLVAEGYATAVPHFLDAYGITPRQRRRTWSQFRADLLADFGRIADEVSTRVGADRQRVYAVGFSNGGYWAAYLAGKGVVRVGVASYAAVTEAGNDREVENLTAALTRSSGPVLFLHGTEDETVGVGAVRRLERKVAGSKAIFVYYDGAGHRFERDSGSANDKAAEDAWKRTLAFLASH